MRALTPIRLALYVSFCGILLLPSPPRVRAQGDASDPPLGDVARSLRKKNVSPEAVIDNDNLPKVMDEAESRRAIGASPVFSLDPGGKTLRVSSPDVMCSLSFTAKTSSLLADPLMLDELPREEIAKLDGPATIDGDSLQVSVHNGSSWELREVLIGLTIVRRPVSGETAYYGHARFLPAAETGAAAQSTDASEKQPDVTLLLRVKGSAAPATTAVFRTSLNFALFPDQEWHWAIVKAKGVPPQALPNPSITPPVANPLQFPGDAHAADGQVAPPSTIPPVVELSPDAAH